MRRHCHTHINNRQRYVQFEEDGKLTFVNTNFVKKAIQAVLSKLKKQENKNDR